MKSTAFTAIVIAFGEVESISAFMFRLRGERLLSLCGESKQRRTKGKRETLSGCFPFPFGNPFSFRRIADRLRTASVRCLTFLKSLGSPRDVEVSISTAPTARGSRCVIVSVSPRAFMRGGEPRAVEGRGDFKGERETAPNGFPLSFDASLVTFVAKRKLPPAA